MTDLHSMKIHVLADEYSFLCHLCARSLSPTARRRLQLIQDGNADLCARCWHQLKLQAAARTLIPLDRDGHPVDAPITATDDDPS